MRYIKTFENYSSTEITNEGLWKGIVNKVQGKKYGHGNKDEEESAMIKTQFFYSLQGDAKMDRDRELFKENPGLKEELKKPISTFSKAVELLESGEDFETALKDVAPITAKVLNTIYQACDTDGNVKIETQSASGDTFQDIYDNNAKSPANWSLKGVNRGNALFGT